MAYPQELINEVLDYLDSGHSVREAERRFGVGGGAPLNLEK